MCILPVCIFHFYIMFFLVNRLNVPPWYTLYILNSGYTLSSVNRVYCEHYALRTSNTVTMNTITVNYCNEQLPRMWKPFSGSRRRGLGPKWSIDELSDFFCNDTHSTCVSMHIQMKLLTSSHENFSLITVPAPHLRAAFPSQHF